MFEQVEVPLVVTEFPRLNIFELWDMEKQMRGLQAVGREAKAYGGGHGIFSDAVKFMKTGKEIQDAILGKIKVIQADAEESRKEIGEICKRRDLDLKEALEAAEDDVKFEAYSTENFRKAPQSNNALRELEKDFHTLRALTFGIQKSKEDVEELNRVFKHIEPARKFDLSYGELFAFGF